MRERNTDGSRREDHDPALSPAKRPVDQPVEPDRERRNNYSGQNKGEEEPEAETEVTDPVSSARQVAHADPDVRIAPGFLHQPREEEERKVGAQHHRVAVREVPELQDAVDQCQSKSPQRQDAADDDSDDEQLALVHRRPQEKPADEHPQGGRARKATRSPLVVSPAIAEGGLSCRLRRHAQAPRYSRPTSALSSSPRASPSSLFVPIAST